ncbi:hypothetical protein GSI_07929 [Ganoderma sinense ZZ0214-1]|uniref:Uncharacterized protein n=1 Tax=Ganoderma sinense ZZ0214-1 TaxID=1077348 RepID=A0A2G8S8F3_9APHY|nr:hypothetical protein GSI_07929 [Ganoderma sinense ZZ0214-1]
MRLSEFYILLGTMFSLALDGMVMQHNMIYKDEDLLILELAAYRMRKVLKHPDSSDFCQEIKTNMGRLKDHVPCLRLRDDAYSAGSFWQKVVWWHDNLWADDPTWVAAAMVIASGTNGMLVRDALTPQTDTDDWVRCVTHSANRVYEEVSVFAASPPFRYFN